MAHGKDVTFPHKGSQTAGYLARPDGAGNGRTVVVIHEWWGLNEHTKDIARRYADAGFIAFAPDLYGGTVTKDPKRASELMHALDPEDGVATLKSAVDYLTTTPGVDPQRIGVTGFCMGGSFTLLAACRDNRLRAAVPFYGDAPSDKDLKSLEAPVLFIGASKDGWITPAKIRALGADPAGPSQYLKTKAAGEAIVMASGLRWTIFRPSVIFGREDSFLNMFAQLAKSLPVIALAAPNARFQPIYVEDVAHCVVQSVTDDVTVHTRYDLCGPKVYTLRQLVAYAGEVSGAVRPIIPLGPAMSKLQATLLEHLPGKLMSRDNLLSTQKDNVCDCPFPAVFGIAPVSLEAVAPQYLSPGAQRSAFDPYRAQGGR